MCQTRSLSISPSQINARQCKRVLIIRLIAADARNASQSFLFLSFFLSTMQFINWRTASAGCCHFVVIRLNDMPSVQLPLLMINSLLLNISKNLCYKNSKMYPLILTVACIRQQLHLQSQLAYFTKKENTFCNV